MQLATTSLGREAPLALVCGTAENITSFVAATSARGWRESVLVGAICADAGSVRIAGLPVLSRVLNTHSLLSAHGNVTEIILCDPVGDREVIRAFLETSVDLGLRPKAASLGDSHVCTRDLSIADLLACAPSAVDWMRIGEVIGGRRVLVTGAGGSIGSELCRQLATLAPARLTLLDSSEFNLYSIDHHLAAAAPDLPRGRVLCDIRDADAVARWFKRERPDIVLHVAALKHVPMVEEFAGEGVLTNVLGTRNVAEAALAQGAHMMLVSTDKAVEPASVMGATKRAAEMVCQALDRRSALADGPRFIVARLGNVLGSTGSVTPMFERQIAAGGPVTVTHPDVARFFITIPQAAGFLLQALAAGLAGHAPHGAALVLDMGEPVRVVDLARDMIRLSGLRPDHDIAVEFVGLRPGEKLIEQLIDESESVAARPSSHIMAVRGGAFDLDALNADIDRLGMLARAGHDELVSERLHALVAGHAGARRPAVLAAL